MPLILLALMMRVLIPAGWMPSAEKGQMITLCTGMGVKQAWLGHDGALQDQAPEEKQHGSDPDQNPCAFSGIGFAAINNAVFAPAPRLVSVETQMANIGQEVNIGRGLAAPPPPATGPPTLI